MKSDALIYVVEDEVDIAQLIKTELESYGYRVHTYGSGAALTRALIQKVPALCILDLGLPDMDGLSLVRELDKHPNLGVLILSGRGSLPDRVLGLELGADDYLAKPFDPRELVARVHSILRRVGKSEFRAVDASPGNRVARFSGWTLDIETLEIAHESGRTEQLSAGEAQLLLMLLQAPKKILSRERLLQQNDEAFDRSVDVRMSRIRKKIEQDPKSPTIIKTVYGMGYMLTSDVQWLS